MPDPSNIKGKEANLKVPRLNLESYRRKSDSRFATKFNLISGLAQVHVRVLGSYIAMHLEVMRHCKTPNGVLRRSGIVTADSGRSPKSVTFARNGWSRCSGIPTLLNVEGLGRQLDPNLDLWTTAKRNPRR